MVLPRRIFVRVSGARNRSQNINYDSYLIFRPRDRTPKNFPKRYKSKDFSSFSKDFPFFLIKGQNFLWIFSHYIYSLNK